jgi:hypothetical protein
VAEASDMLATGGTPCEDLVAEEARQRKLRDCRRALLDGRGEHSGLGSEEGEEEDGEEEWWEAGMREGGPGWIP